jgi:hypothetical protein
LAETTDSDGIIGSENKTLVTRMLSPLPNYPQSPYYRAWQALPRRLPGFGLPYNSLPQGDEKMRLSMCQFQAGLALTLSLVVGLQTQLSAQEAPPAPPAEVSEAPSVLSVAPEAKHYSHSGATISDCASGNCSGNVVAGRSIGASGQVAQRALKAAKTPVTPAVCNGDCTYRHYGPHDLFRQYYVPNNCGGPAAELYPAPHYVPPHVGHVYYTYQPLYPHEFLYDHHRTYHRYYDNGRGLTRTSVKWW